MADKPKKVKYISPKGVAMWPRLNSPDTKFVPEGEFKVDLRMSAEAAQPLADKLQPQLDKWVAEVKADPKNKGKKIKVNPITHPVLDDEGNETGDVFFRFKMKATIKNKDGSERAMRPDLFDAQGQKMSPDILIYGGSLLKVAFTVGTYYKAASGAGLKLYLGGAQVIKLVSNERNAASYGFGDESDDEDADVGQGGPHDDDDENDDDEGGDGEEDF